jgi:hypothetical protein
MRLIQIKARVVRLHHAPPGQQRSLVMPLETIIVLAVVFSAFSIFAITLAVAERRTRLMHK